MTDAERLAIAEEIIKSSHGSWVCNLPDVALRWSHDAKTKKKEYTAQRTADHGGYICGGGPDLAVSECPIEAIYQARQKLAAEREAKKSPRERRLEKALQSIQRSIEHMEWKGSHSFNDVVDLKCTALEALKEDN